jgi:hypothetical protein
MNTTYSDGIQLRGWLCPLCNGAHGPHVDRCSGPAMAPAVSVPSVFGVTPLTRCLCDSSVPCGDVACPHRVQVTWAAIT